MPDHSFTEMTEGISLRQLRLFEAIGQFNSVRRASEECSLSQPAVTQSLSKLERHIGLVLVDRTASGSFLNEDGAIFHARVERFFQQAIATIISVGAAPDNEGARLILNRLSRAQIRAIISVLEHGAIQQAAEALGITVASLQRAARDLEANLGTNLFYRTAMGVLVNPRGLELGRSFKIALQEIEFGLEEIAETRGASQRQIVIGAMPLGGSVLLAGVLNDFTRRFPKAKIRIMSESASEITESLRLGDVDFVVGLLPDVDSDEMDYEALASTPYNIVASHDHPLILKGSASFDDLRSYDWIVGTQGSSRRAFFDRLFEGAPAPRSSVTTSAPPIIRRLLEQGDRLTLMTSYELDHEIRLRTVRYAGALDAPQIGIIHRKNWQPTRLHRALIDLLRNFAVDPVARESLLQAV